jgi:hypothetical protein
MLVAGEKANVANQEDAKDKGGSKSSDFSGEEK